MALTPHQAAGKKLGAFELVREVSASSVGATFIARGKDRADSVVLTKVHRHVAKSALLCENFLSEARRVATFVHPNVSEVLDSGTIDGEPYLTHAWSESETLLSLLRRVGPDGLPVGVAARITLDAASAIQAAQAAGNTFGHGELGPWCVHIGASGSARVSGFAVDRAISRFGLHFAKNLDRLPYAAPERVKPMSLTLGPPPPAPDASSDLFSLAVLAWELLTRNKLFASRMEAAVVQKVIAAAIPDAKSQREEVPEALSAAISKALTRDAAQRGNIQDLIDALEAASPASNADVREFASRIVEKSQVRPASATSGVARAFSSVAPGPTAPVKASNGDASKLPNGDTSKPQPKPPLRPRATTLMGMALTPPAVPKDATPIEDEPTVEARVSATELRDSSIEIMLEEPSTQDGNDLVESTTVDPPRKEAAPAARPASVPPPPSPKTASVPPPPKAPSVPPPAPAARRKPPLRQHTLMGIEPVALSEADNAIAQATTTPSPAPNVAKPIEDAAKPAVAAEPDTQLELGPGLTLQGTITSYQLIDAVARGGMATVWAARPSGSRGLSNLVAVKTMLAELSDEADFASMFSDEVRVASKIEHENVARSFDCVTQQDAVFLIMEWIDGDTLGALQNASRASGGIPENVLVRVARGICAGLHAAHELKDTSGSLIDLVHRDVSPANLMVTRGGLAKIVDFGIAKSKGRVHVTRVGSTVKGKTPYLSPEQLGGIPIDRRSDLFSLGCVLYTMTTGVHPFRGESELRTIENIVLKTPANPRGLAPELHPEFEKLILQLLEKDPKKRPASAEAVEKSLEKIEALLANPATTADVGAFVERALAEPLRERDASLEAAASKLDAKSALPKAPVKGSARAAEPQAKPATLEAEPISSSSLAIPAPPAEVIAEVAPIESPFTLSPTASPVESAGEVPPVPSEPALDSSPIAPAVDTSSDATSPLAVTDPSEDAARPSDRRRGLSPWARLTILVVMGVLAGVAIIAMIESMREKPEAKTPPTATQSAATKPPPVAPTQAPTPTQTTPPPEPTATATATESAAPSAEPTSTQAVDPPPEKTVPRPTTTTTGQKPPKFKPPPFNPTTI